MSVYIKKFLTKIAEQDNRCTAAPYFYVIQTKVEAAAYEGCGDRVYYFNPENPECQFLTVEEYIAHAKECENYESMDSEDRESFDNRIEDIEYNLTKIEVSDSWVEKGMFLTEEDAENHLKRNHYHYSSDARTYVKHCWRAPEMERFFAELYNHFNIDIGNLDLNIKRILEK